MNPLTLVIEPLINATYAVREAILLQPSFSHLESFAYAAPRILATKLELSDSMMTFLIAMHLSLILSLPLSLMRSPSKRRWYATMAGLIVGFYAHGLANFVCLFQFLLVYPTIKYMPR